MPQFQGPPPGFGGGSGPVFVHTGPWQHGWFGWLLPILFLAVVAGLVIWVVLRVTRRPPVLAPAWGPPRFGSDAALGEARLRYARGEMSREDFLQVSGDLGTGGRGEVEPPA